MKKSILAALLLCLVPGFALASSGSAFSAIAVTSHSDLSVSYLAQIFGTVGTVLQGTAGQMLGQFFKTFNLGILTVAGVYLIPTTILITLRAASSGSFMGQETKAHFVIIRILIGIALLAPDPSQGYSAMQKILTQVGVWGIDLADNTWAAGMEYLKAGGLLWKVPTGTDADGNATLLTDTEIQGTQNASGDGVLGHTTVGTNNLPGLGMAQRVFASEVCMVTSSIQNQQKQSPVMPSYQVWESDSDNAFFFPGAYDPAGQSQGSNCGFIAYDGVPGTAYGTSSGGSTTNYTCHARGSVGQNGGQWCEFSRLSVMGLINDLMPAAKMVACSYYAGNANVAACSGSVVSDANAVSSAAADALFNAVLNYANAIMPLQNGQSGAANSSSITWMDQSAGLGWASAGRFYPDLISMDVMVQNAKSLNTYVPHGVKGAYSVSVSPLENNILSPNEGTGKTTPAYSMPAVESAVDTAINNMGDTGQNWSQNAISQINQYAGATATGQGTGDSSTPTSGNAWIDMILPLAGDIDKLNSQFHTYNMGSDPILFLHNVGSTCLDVSADIWLAPIASLFGIFALFSICNSEVNAQGSLNAVFNWVQPFFMVLAGAFFVPGAVLALYVPLAPFFHFTFGQVNYLILFIEALVAAPIICLGFTHPTGHDLLGKSEQAVMLALSLFLRPTLMIIGLVGGMILSFVAFKIVIFGYAGVMYDLFTPAHTAASASTGDVYGGVHSAYEAMLKQAKPTTEGMTLSYDAGITYDCSAIMDATTPYGAEATDAGAAACAAQTTGQAIGAAGANIGYDLGEVNQLLGMSAHYINKLLLQPIMLMIFGYLVFEIIELSYSLIHRLPDYVCRWIGVPTEQSQVAGLSARIKDITGSGAGSAGKSMETVGGEKGSMQTGMQGAFGSGKKAGGGEHKVG